MPSDSDLKKAVLDELIREPSVNVKQGGKITLSGKVSTWNARQMVGVTAWSALARCRSKTTSPSTIE